MLSSIKSYFCRVFAIGPVPKHVVLSFDGNRRWAKQNELAIFQGHLSGLRACIDAVRFFKIIGVKELTTFLMSTANFNRDGDQVETLFETMGIAIDSFVREFGDCRIRVTGNRLLLPIDLQRKIQKVEEMTMANDKFTIYLAIAYSSRDAICQKLSRLAELWSPDSISVDLLDQHLVNGDYMVDLFIRTSGETRLSDLCLWEVNILNEFLIFHLLIIVLGCSNQRV